MAVYGIDMGHNTGAGASKILNETTENRKIGKELIRMLKEKGHTVVDCTNENAVNQLSGIVNKANAQSLDLFCSIHLNSGGGHGTETYIWNGTWSNKEKNRAIAKRINDAVVSSCNFRNRGVKEANFYVLRATNAPAILVEVCFVDSQEDANKLNHVAVAKALFKGITNTEYVESAPSVASYRVKITADVLNVRKQPTTSSTIVTTVKKGEVYTIVGEESGWGKLKSGAGWISLNYTTKC